MPHRHAHTLAHTHPKYIWDTYIHTFVGLGKVSELLRSDEKRKETYINNNNNWHVDNVGMFVCGYGGKDRPKRKLAKDVIPLNSCD